MNISGFFKSTVPFLRGGAMLSVLFAVPVTWGLAWSVYAAQCTRRYRGYFSNDCKVDKAAYVLAATAFTTLSLYAFYKLNSIYENLNRSVIHNDVRAHSTAQRAVTQDDIKDNLIHRILTNFAISIGLERVLNERETLISQLRWCPMDYLNRLNNLMLRMQGAGIGVTANIFGNVGDTQYLELIERQFNERRSQVSGAEQDRLDIVDIEIDLFKTSFKNSSAEQLIQYHSREAGQSLMPFKVFAEHGHIQTFDVEGKKVEVMYVDGSKLNVVGNKKRPAVDKDGDAAFIVYDARDVGEEYKISNHMLKLLKQAHETRDKQVQLAR